MGAMTVSLVDAQLFIGGQFWAAEKIEPVVEAAGSRILAPRSRYAEITAALSAMANSLTVGDPLDDTVDIGLQYPGDRHRQARYTQAAPWSGSKHSTYENPSRTAQAVIRFCDRPGQPWSGRHRSVAMITGCPRKHLMSQALGGRSNRSDQNLIRPALYTLLLSCYVRWASCSSTPSGSLSLPQ